MNRWMMLTALVTMGSVMWATPSMAQGKKASAMLTSVDELKWTDVAEVPGVQTATAEGDPTKGQHHFFVKFPAGFEVGMHHHTADHYGTLVKGTFVLTVDGKEKRLPAGSFIAFTNKTKHATKCEAGSECVLFIDSRAAWDVVMADTKAKKM